MGVYDLGLTNDAFWGLTLRQFDLLAERHMVELKRADRRAGGIIAMLYNINRPETDRTGKDWDDFFTEWKEPQPEQTEDQMLEVMQMWTKIQPLPS